MTTTILGTPLNLPCGATLPNRLAKAAMSEGLADADNQATPRLEALYRRWANSGAGLLLTGNLQVDRWHLERPSNVVLDDEAGLPALAAVAAAGKAGGSHFWAQLSHTGRQVSDAINPAPLSPSSVDIDVPRGLGYSFAKPREMTEADIDHAIRQFAFAAQYARRAGFTGVQLHAAHGYLISQFLSPLSNRRTDRWGGPLESRSRFLLAIINAVRGAVGSDFPIGIKLNSSDFQKGASPTPNASSWFAG
jgi:2,4-dienoyl-CoA reductase-like NADH-dependent reductase (Old Yellow Enzyme family)